MKTLFFGKLNLKSNVIYSPLAGCSDFPFRKMAAFYSPGLMFCEMVKVDPLLRNDKNTFHMLDYDSSMRPIGAQICGSGVSLLSKGAKIVEDLGFDVLDLNCGCPVDKVTKDGSGSGMLKNPELIGEAIAKMVSSVQIPVTIKIRIGWDDDNIIAEEITRIAELAGAKAIFIHGRTRKQGYKGPANWEYIKKSKEIAKEIKVIGNGDIFSPQNAQKIVRETGCDGVLVSRGTMGNPWFCEQIVDFENKGNYKKRTLEDKKRALFQHLEFILKYKKDQKALVDLRRIGAWYINKEGQVKAFRKKVYDAKTVADAKKIIFEWESFSDCALV